MAKKLSPLSLLGSWNRNYSKPKVIDILEQPENEHLLNYVINDAFGAHVFPGDLLDYSTENFLANLNTQLTQSNPIHLWLNLPLCEKRCFFCQFPITIARNQEHLQKTTQKWLDANIIEARLWLEAVPELKKIPIGEFNI